MSESSLTTIEVLPPETALTIPAEVSQDFAEARKILALSGLALKQSIAYQILLGFELIRLHDAHGVKAGRKAKSANSQLQLGIKWEPLVKQELGISGEWARQLMAVSDTTKKKLPAPLIKELVTRPLIEWTTDEVKRLDAGVKETIGTGEQSFRQYAIALGVIKESKGSGASPNPDGRPEGTTDPRTLAQRAHDAVWEWLKPLGEFLTHGDHATFILELPLHTDADKDILASLKEADRALKETAAMVKEAIQKHEGKKKSKKPKKNLSAKSIAKEKKRLHENAEKLAARLAQEKEKAA